MLTKIMLFWVLFTLFALVLHFVASPFLSAFLLALFAVLLFYILIRRDANRLNLKIKAMQNLAPNSDEKPFLDENLELHSSLSELSEEIREKNKKSLKKSAKIKLRNSQLQGILSSISHEFKNPIAIIKASSQTIINDKNLSDEMRGKFIDKIVRNSQRIVDLIDRLNLRSSESLTLSRSEFDLRELALSAKAELLERYKGREILVANGRVIINADEVLIKQVVVNLIENALKYSQEAVEVSFDGGCFLVRDSGVGIDQKEIKLITKKYFKTKDNISTNSLGLGLYIVKQILKMHAFEMIVSSKVGQGSTFGFKFKESGGEI